MAATPTEGDRAQTAAAAQPGAVTSTGAANSGAEASQRIATIAVALHGGAQPAATATSAAPIAALATASVPASVPVATGQGATAVPVAAVTNLPNAVASSTGSNPVSETATGAPGTLDSSPAIDPATGRAIAQANVPAHDVATVRPGATATDPAALLTTARAQSEPVAQEPFTLGLMRATEHAQIEVLPALIRAQAFGAARGDGANPGLERLMTLDAGHLAQLQNALSQSGGGTESATLPGLMHVAGTTPGFAVPTAPQVPIPFLPQQPAFEQAVGDRVLWMIQNQSSSAQLRIHPPHLGPLEVHVSMNQDTANVQFISHHASVRDALEAALPRLREWFAQSGLNLGDVNVSHQSPREGGDGAGPAGGADAYNLDAVGGAEEVAHFVSTPLAARGLVDLYA